MFELMSEGGEKYKQALTTLCQPFLLAKHTTTLILFNVSFSFLGFNTQNYSLLFPRYLL